jgi:hypothetical protein
VCQAISRAGTLGQPRRNSSRHQTCNCQRPLEISFLELSYNNFYSLKSRLPQGADQNNIRPSTHIYTTKMQKCNKNNKEQQPASKK